MCRSGTTYWPDSLLEMVRTRPVSTFVMVIFTLAITDPLGSVTVPTTVASCAIAENETPRTSTQRSTACCNPILLIERITLRVHNEERIFIAIRHPSE